MTHFEISDDELSTEILHAEIDRLRAELAELRASRRWEYIEALEDRAEKAEAAIARVRVVLEEDVDDDAARYNALRALDGAE